MSCLELEALVDYFNGALAESDEDVLESHLFGCSDCTARAEQLAGLVTALRDVVPPVLSTARFAAFEREGRVETINVMTPGETAEVKYPTPGRLLIHRFQGVDLSGTRRLDLDLISPGGEAIVRLDNVPFDAARGEILVACQSHFVETFPRDLVFAVHADDKELARYTVYHRT